MADNNKKANGFSFVNISVCVDTTPSSNGGTFFEMVLVGPLTRIEKKLIGDKHLVSGTMAINGRAQYLNQVLGVSNVLGYELEEDATVWAQVSFWGKQADRLDKYLANAQGSKSHRLLVIGKLTPNAYPGADGRMKLGLNLSVFNWQALSASKKDSGGSSWPSVAPATFDSMPQPQFGAPNGAAPSSAPASWGGSAPAQAPTQGQKPGWGAGSPSSSQNQRSGWGNGTPPQAAPNQNPGWGKGNSNPAQAPTQPQSATWGASPAAPSQQQPSWGSSPAPAPQQPSWGSHSPQPGNGFSIDDTDFSEGDLPF